MRARPSPQGQVPFFCRDLATADGATAPGQAERDTAHCYGDAVTRQWGGGGMKGGLLYCGMSAGWQRENMAADGPEEQSMLGLGVLLSDSPSSWEASKILLV